MKRTFWLIILVGLLAVISAGCGKKAPDESLPEMPLSPTETQLPIQTEAPTEHAEESFPGPQLGDTVPYLQKVYRADQSIFSEPSYDSGFAGTVQVAGTYTIMEEAWDEEGNLWGKLKSGAGWIDLTEVRKWDPAVMPMTANYAGKKLLSSGNFEHFVGDTSEYAVQIVFLAHRALYDVAFFRMELNEAGLQEAELLYHIPEMSSESPFVADVSFPSDMTTYGIRFNDDSGNVYRYTVCMSGRNGTLEFLPWKDAL